MLAGARVNVLRTGERTLTLVGRRRGSDIALRALLDPDRPLVAATAAAQTDESGPGSWAAGVAALVRGSVVDAVGAVPHDRILNVDLRSRSAFGVPALHRLVLELEPRKVNALVLRRTSEDDGTVLAMARPLSATASGRAVAVGDRYVLPKIQETRIGRDEFREGARAILARSQVESRALVRLLNDVDPACTPPLARRIIDDVIERPSERVDPAAAPELMLRAWAELRPHVVAAVGDLNASMYAYRSGDVTSACHVVALHWPAGELVRSATLNELCAQEIEQRERSRITPVAAGLRKKLERTIERGAAEASSLAAAVERARAADELREKGDAIYASLAAIKEGESLFITPDGIRIELDQTRSAKQNAAEYFRRYRKARSGLPRIEARLKQLELLHTQWEQLLWELDRADAEPSLRTAIYDDVGAALGRRPAVRKPPARNTQTPVTLSGGALAYVGRSPRDNERLTFSVARANDWWFHARGVPGAHVVLKLQHAGESPTDEQIAAAAALAAGASRARDAAKVEVDYTQRKHVRRQGKGATGQVWYTDFKTIAVSPSCTQE